MGGYSYPCPTLQSTLSTEVVFIIKLKCDKWEGILNPILLYIKYGGGIHIYAVIL